MRNRQQQQLTIFCSIQASFRPLYVVQVMVSSYPITSKENIGSSVLNSASIARDGLIEEISKKVLRKKLAKQRHLVIEKAIHPNYLDSIFPTMLDLFDPQIVHVRF